MTAFAFPLARQNLADLLMLETVVWQLRYFQELGGLAGGEWVARDLAPTVWDADCSTVAGDEQMIEELAGRFNVIEGSIESFYLYNPSRRPVSVGLAAAGVTISSIADNRKEITLAGVPPGELLRTGAMLSVTAGSPARTALFQLAAAATAGATLAGPVEVRPHLRPWLVAGQSVQLVRPVAKVKLLSGSLTKVQVSSVLWRLRFTARQTLAAG